MSPLHCCLHDVSRHICPEVLPRPPGERHQSYVHDDRGRSDEMHLMLNILAEEISRALGTRRMSKVFVWGELLNVLESDWRSPFARIWYSITGWVTVFSPLVNFGRGHITGALSPWRYPYILAGSLTTVWGLLLVFVLPPDPIRAKGFSEHERYILVARLRSNNATIRNTHFKRAQVLELLCDVKFWLLFYATTLSMIANAPISTFLPIAISSVGFSSFESLLLVMPIGAYNGIVVLLASFCACRFQRVRTYIIFICEMIVVLAAALLWKLPFSATCGLLLVASSCRRWEQGTEWSWNSRLPIPQATPSALLRQQLYASDTALVSL